MKKNETAKTDLYQLMINNPMKTKEEIAKLFMELGYKNATVYRWIALVEKNKSLKRKKGSGRPLKIATRKNLIRLRNHFDHKSGRSQKIFVQRLGCTQAYVSMMLKNSTHIKGRKKFKRPLLTIEQRRAARPKCGILYKKYGKLDFILDDESYFTLSHTAQSGNNIFYSSNLNLTPESVSSNYRSKYEPKLLVYILISPRGMCKPYFRPSGLAVNQDVYLEECIKKLLIPFIRENYRPGQYVFWPDLASCHYAHKVQDYLKPTRSTMCLNGAIQQMCQKLGLLKIFGEISKQMCTRAIGEQKTWIRLKKKFNHA